MSNNDFFLPGNIKRLRHRKKLSQEVLADKLNITRSKLNALELGQTKNPSLNDLFTLSNFFQISIDSLVKVDLTSLSEVKLGELEEGNDMFLTGSKLRILAVTTDKEFKENIEFVPVKAKAGYISGYNDPEFIKTLPKFQMPNLPKNKTFRMFSITGESMPPFEEGDCILAEYVENWFSLQDSTLCILILKSEQDFVFKRIVNDLKDNRRLLLNSFNGNYKTYEVMAEDICEVWKYHSYWSKNIRENKAILKDISEKVEAIQKDLNSLKEI